MEIEKLTKELASELMKIKGECRGMTLKADWEHVLQEKGEEGLKRLEVRMAELGYPIKYKDIRAMDFYPIGMDAISIIAIKELFNYDEKGIEKMGASSVKFSLFTKILMKYFVSLATIADQIPKLWRRHYTIGDAEMPEFSEEKGYVIIKLKNFHVHPVYCIVFRGYFPKVTEMVVNSSVNCEETKCTFRGDEHHEFLFTWQPKSLQKN